MSRSLIKIACCVAAGLLSAAMGEGIVGSKHDFAGKGFDARHRCLACHPSEEPDAVGTVPLWDQRDQARGPYRMFNGRPGTPGRETLICLGCHDGSGAVDMFGATAAGRSGLDIRRSLVVGAHGDLSSDHPVGVRYPEHDTAFHQRAAVERGGRVRLFNGKVECASCHDVHNMYGQPKMLVKSNDRSALCLTCHRK